MYPSKATIVQLSENETKDYKICCSEYDCSFTFDYQSTTKGLMVYVSQTNESPGPKSCDSYYDTPLNFVVK